jgi:hypothetical protein
MYRYIYKNNVFITVPTTHFFSRHYIRWIQFLLPLIYIFTVFSIFGEGAAGGASTAGGAPPCRRRGPSHPWSSEG